MTKYKGIKINGKKRDYHRYLMEQKLGRMLERDEVVHHINGNTLDNNIDNLMLMPLSEHARMHQLGRKASEETKQKLSLIHTGKPNVSQRKLTNEQVDYIRKHYIPRDREFGARALGRKFGISHSHILEIINNIHYVSVG